MKIKVKRSFFAFLINPVLLLLIGSFIGVLPGLIKNKILLNYSYFVETKELYLVYLLGFLFFLFGYVTISIIRLFHNSLINFFKNT